MRISLFVSCLLAVALLGDVAGADRTPESAGPSATVRQYLDGWNAGDSGRIRAALGNELFMFNGNFSGDPTNWQAHLFLRGDELDRWPATLLQVATPMENRYTVVHEHIRGKAAVVVTEETGNNKFRSWQGEKVTYLVALQEGTWRIVGIFIRDVRNPE